MTELHAPKPIRIFPRAVHLTEQDRRVRDSGLHDPDAMTPWENSELARLTAGRMSADMEYALHKIFGPRCANCSHELIHGLCPNCDPEAA